MMKKPHVDNQMRPVRQLMILMALIMSMLALVIVSRPMRVQAEAQVDNSVIGRDVFNIPKGVALQYTYVHEPLTKVQGAHAWKGADYAAKIPMDAKGVDPQTKQNYIDEWMPDRGFQVFIYEGSFKKAYPSFGEFINNFTKNDMQAIETIDSTNDLQRTITNGKQVPTLYFQAMMSMKSIEGMQYATNLEKISLVPQDGLSEIAWGIHNMHSNLWDISALKNLDKLKEVILVNLSINDVSALANKPNLTTINLSFNQIADLSPLETNRNNPGLNLKHGFGYQHILLAPITLRTGTKEYTTPSFIIKDLQANNLPVSPYDSLKESNDYPSLYPSTANSQNIDPITLNWTNLLQDPEKAYGSLSSHWKDPNSDFEGWIMVPYTLSDVIGNVYVNFQLLKADGTLVTIAPGAVLSGGLTQTYDLESSPETQSALATARRNGYDRLMVIGGTGNYADFLRHDGSATAVGLTGNFEKDSKNRTIIFTTRTVEVPINYVDTNGNQIAGVSSETLKGKVDAKVTADDLNRLKKAISGYTFNHFQAADGHNIDLSAIETYGDIEKGLKLVYIKDDSQTNANSGTATGTTNDSKTNSDQKNTGSTTSQSDKTATTSESGKGTRKGEAVYALKKVYLYKNQDFKKSERLASYAKKPRINRPMFVVIGYGQSKAGNNRYKVRDVNHHSKTAGKVGYLTTKWDYVRPVYYHSSHQTLTVINPKGVNEYRNKNLTGKVRNFKQGIQLKVKGFVKHRLTTRYLLTNGNYVTGNRKLVMAGKVAQAKQIRVKKTIYRYNNANFGKRLKRINPGTILKVKKWEYTQPYSLTSFGAKRYQVVGGYVTGNERYVSVK
ncbi:DUF5776 domain-containing protein [Lentilactobacillus fungorum]|nr:DUF5776 domain-containing protein [Lentilactobacillus fungorum]